jgi:hypothetical protein
MTIKVTDKNEMAKRKVFPLSDKNLTAACFGGPVES